MLSEELLRMIQADREREIKAARRVREVREALSAAPGRGGVRMWFDRRLAAPSETPPARSQTGSAATDPSA